MNTALIENPQGAERTSRALQALYEAEKRLQDRFARLVNGLNAPVRVKFLLLENHKRPGGDPFNRLWARAAAFVARFHVKRRDTDWVFENFWPNAAEPKHSKLLAFFLDPQEPHDCGLYLLGKLLPLLEEAARRRNSRAEPLFIADGCIVKAESGGRIDLRVERECNGGKFAIIIENKLNNAIDQYGYRTWLEREGSQLEDYVERVRYRDFKYHEIFVFYLPLDGGRDAKPEDIKAITRLGVTYAQITFEDHIGKWINAALKDWQHPNIDLREHLSYYGRLIAYLVNKSKQPEMDAEILKTIEETEKTGFLTLSEIDAAINAARSLRQVFVRVVRARLLRRIHGELCKNGLHPSYYVCEWPRILRAKTEPESEYTDESLKITVGIQINEAWAVGFGWSDEDGGGFLFSYLRLQDEQGQHDEDVQREAHRRLGEIFMGGAGSPFYAFKYELITPEQCEEQKTASDYADRVSEMWKGLQKVLG